MVQRSPLLADNVVLLGLDYLQLSLEQFTAKCEAAGMGISGVPSMGSDEILSQISQCLVKSEGRMEI